MKDIDTDAYENGIRRARCRGCQINFGDRDVRYCTLDE